MELSRAVFSLSHHQLARGILMATLVCNAVDTQGKRLCTGTIKMPLVSQGSVMLLMYVRSPSVLPTCRVGAVWVNSLSVSEVSELVVSAKLYSYSPANDKAISFSTSHSTEFLRLHTD
ncbi:uncharacterized protein HD556DRAFT_61 [Suillus plorans]|uniref:Uncharacterized protein n=1 Tax=Suillus plorans TaxID=116603 RepID=A0A9P7J9D0_9AGAM|nr:uncharacterized protein HD556DRAFT_61 [Suillus plorans]KAG1809748.1 hypothetical protein HD556DRAFT_61 [Suillus plorans]